MKAICRTNLDVYNEEWPIFVNFIPRIGDYVVSQTKHGVFQLKLKVVSVTWTSSEIVDIELHDYRGYSLRKFYEWYAPLVGKSVSYFI